MADNVTGIVLDIPASVLQNIKNADKAIKDLEQTSKKAAQSIKRDFDTTMVSGVEAFIRKVQEAQSKLGNLKMPTIDATGLSSAVQALSQAMGTIDKSATTGSNRLGRIADAMAKLQATNPDPQLFQNVSDGITKIGGTSQQTIDNVKNLAAAMAQLARDIRTVQNAQNAQNANTATAAQYNKLYKEQAELIRQKNELERKGANATAEEKNLLDAIKARYAEIAQQINKLNQKKQTAASDLANLRGENKVNQAKNITTVQGAVNYAQQARSLNELQAAYKNLKAVMATTKPNTAEWNQMNTVLAQTRTRIDEIKKKMGEFKSTAQGVGDIAGQMKRTLAAVFSVSAITSYINKMIEVRAQFELQQTALRAILQDKQKADQVFQQVQQLALQSPFSIMQMTTFTKQLAAYRIEADKLVGTTKMLADVSAGLGVDMQRLILAYGQVKAANYLRATEVRQFTEAGLNIAGELASYFSELQGKMVSVGDVMEMITKRMVRFEDVEEVFKRVTSAGGIFYDMQKKQSETLWGQLQRIKDAISIMFNDIGKSNQSTISTILNLVRSLINHWRMLAPIISTVGAAMATVLAVKGVQAFITSLRTMGAAVATLALKWRGVESAATAAAVAERGATMATGIGVAVTVVTALAGALLGAWQEAHKLNEEFDRISEESSKEMWDSIYKYRELSDAIKDTSKTYEEHKKALEDMQNTFKGILPDQMLQEEHIRNIKDGYDEATEAIKVYYAEKAKEEARESINTEVNKKWEDWIGDMKEQVSAFRNAVPELKNASDAAVRGIIGNITRQLREEYEKGMIKTAEEGYKRFIEITQENFSSFSKTAQFGRNFGQLFTNAGIGDIDFAEVIGFAAKKDEEFTKEYEENSGRRAGANQKEYQQWMEKHENMSKQLDDLYAKMQAVADLKGKGLYYGESSNPDETRGVTDRGAAATDELAKQFSLVNKLRENLGLIPLDWHNITEATNTSTGVLSTFSNIQEEVIGGFKRFVTEHTKNNAVLGWINNLTGGYTTLSAQQQDMIAKSAQIIKMHGLEASVIDKLHITAETNYGAAAAAAKALSDEADANIQKIMATANELINLGRASNIVISISSAIAKAESMWGMFISKLKGEKEAGMDIAKLFGYTDKAANAAPKVPKTPRTRGQGHDKELNRWKNIKKAIEDANKSYEEYRKNYSVKEANQMIENQYGKIFSELGADISAFYKNGKYDAEQLVDALKVLKNMTNQNTEARKKFASEISRKIESVEVDIKMKLREDEIKQLKQDISNIFDNYELTKTLGDLGLNIDLTYLVGGRPVKLEDLRKQFETELSTVKTTGGPEETVKAYEDALRKVADLENKAAVERLKNYSKYLAMTYSDRAKAMIESYTTMKNMERDFADYRKQLEKEAADPSTTKQRRQEISQQISMLEAQARDAIKGVKNDLDTSLNKLDWEAFKGSPVFTQMYSDLETLSKKGIDLLISKLTTMRDKLQAMDNVDYRAVREITKYIEKLDTQRIEVDSWKELNAAIKEANALRKEGNNMDKAQSELMSEQANLDAANAEIANLQTIINLKRQDGTEESKIKNLSTGQLELYRLSEDKLQEMLSTAQDNANAAQANMLKWSGVVTTLQKGKKALEEQSKRIKILHDAFGKVFDSAIDLADALGADTEIWGDFAKGVVDSIFQVIELTVQLKIMGIEANSALGVIGYVAIALQVVASLFASIFRARDKRKEKQIQRLQYKVEDLQKAYEKLQTAIEDAYAFDKYNAEYEKSMRNLTAQRKAVQEQLALEQSKKKSDKDKIREYEDALDELAEKEKELREARYEAMGSVGEKGIRTEAENFVSAWLDAYKETGDGLDALKEHWNEFFENLVLKQASSAVVSKRMKKYVDQINAAIDSGDTGLSLSQTFAQIGQNLKNELGEWNEDLKTFFDAVGIKGSQGELLLSDLQKGIQNITEPQAAAIEAYLNSMRFAVFEQNNILTNMLTAIQAQYGANDNNTMLNEVKAIRALVGSIDDRLSKVIISRNSSNSGYMMKVG